MSIDYPRTHVATTVPLILRLGLGLVFVIGGLSKLSQLLDPNRQAQILESYWGTAGYVNQFFVDFMFTGMLSPWWFLTTLSAFELVSGVALIIGLAVRPLSLLYGFLLWTFVIALPVLTVPGVESDVDTYRAPAIFVQIRDIALSGMMFVLYNIGPGACSIDRSLFHQPAARDKANWNTLGLLLRLSVAAPLIVGGVFFAMPNIPTFATPFWVLLPVGLLLVAGLGLRAIGTVVALIMGWYMIYKFNADASLIGNLNGFKREFAFLAAGVVLAIFGGGTSHTLASAVNRFQGEGRRTNA